ncbi:MAG: hypothetical protein V3573_10800 [Desulfovibrionaceae bacterium]
MEPRPKHPCPHVLDDLFGPSLGPCFDLTPESELEAILREFCGPWPEDDPLENKQETVRPQPL